MVTLLAALVVASAAAASNPPSPSSGGQIAKPQTETSQHQSQAGNAQIRPESPPSSIKLAKTSVIHEPTGHKADENRDYAGPEWGLVYITAALALFTLGLATYTGLLYRSTVRTGKDAARTAKEALEFNQKSRQPVIAPLIRDASRLYPAKGSSQFALHSPVVAFTWENYGQSPAFLLRAELLLIPEVDLPKDGPDWSKAVVRRDSDTIAPFASEVTSRTPIQFRPAESFSEATTLLLNTKIERGGVRFHFYGRVLYQDTLGETMICGFAMKIFRDGTHYMRGGQRYNYRRKAADSELPSEAESTTT